MNLRAKSPCITLTGVGVLGGEEKSGVVRSGEKGVEWRERIGVRRERGRKRGRGGNGEWRMVSMQIYVCIYACICLRKCMYIYAYQCVCVVPESATNGTHFNCTHRSPNTTPFLTSIPVNSMS